MADDEDMRSRDELVDQLLARQDRLLDIMEMQARALNRGQQTLDGELLRHLQNDPAALREFYDKAIGTYQPPKRKRPGHRPNEKDMRVWALFRAKFQKLESEVRRDLHLKPEDELTLEMMFANGGEHPKTMVSHMQWHGLGPEQWPPSTWPEKAPETGF